ncbi:hypothetical protein BDN72DRAFT_964709 [Pluteus cervinus]|uniref:Uncharacterized protein n=1 Tax=Pluteus cervinus TaxID=181527 RepID=A0ACD3A8M4_9AGAR|nr:hypothetical protein BDN72DRAFT_964709 [Pluteus cervinus]
MSPVFPPELEYEIFLLAFQNERDNPVNLLLVAKRVQDWLIPQIYHTVVFRDRRRYPRNVTTSLMRRHGHHTRHLLLSFLTNPTKVISYCPNVENLAVWTGSWSHNFGLESENTLTSLKLKRLSVHLGELEHLDMNAPIESDDHEEITEIVQKQGKANILQFFSHITHLDICTRIHRQREIWVLRHFTSLTHICVFDSLPPPVLRWVFDICSELKVVVWLIDNLIVELQDKLVAVISDEKLRGTLELFGGLAHDEIDRVVFVRCNGYGEDWENGARGREDVWVLAERAVEEAKENRKGISGLVTRFSELQIVEPAV